MTSIHIPTAQLTAFDTSDGACSVELTFSDFTTATEFADYIQRLILRTAKLVVEQTGSLLRIRVEDGPNQSQLMGKKLSAWFASFFAWMSLPLSTSSTPA